jgi:hypothetical protein
MSSLADRIAAEAAAIAPVIPREYRAPTGWEPGVRYDPETSLPTEVTTEQVERQIGPGDKGDFEALIAHLLPMVPAGHEVRLIDARYDPVAWTRDTVDQGAAVTRPAWRYRFRIVAVKAAADVRTEDLPALLKAAKANRPARNPVLGTGLTRVVVMSDMQIGKVDSNGGTPELVARLDRLLAMLDDEAKARPCDDVVILDPGDICEGFESTAQEMSTNDQDFPEQLEKAEIILGHAVTAIAARHASTRVAACPSNHTQWRKGKDRLGKPGADFGLKTHRTVARQLAYRDDITFIQSGPWEESLALKVRGAVIGLVHGHQAQSGRIPQWWAGQSHGGQPTAAATMLVTGHYHSFRMEPTGAIDGKARYWLQAPALDGGSSWWRHIKGDESEPGMVTFTVDDAGDWDSLRYLR